MKVVVFSVINHDNVLACCNALAKHSDLDVSLILFAYGNKFGASTMEADIASLPYGLKAGNVVEEVFPAELQDYFDPRLKIWLFKLSPKKISIANLTRNIRLLMNLAKKTRNAFDIFHFNGTGINSLILSYLIRSRNKILTLHDYVPHTGEGNKQSAWINKKLVANFRHFIQHYDYLTEGMAKYFRLKRSDVHTVRSGTFDHFKQFSREKSPYADYILFFGRISPYKGLKYLVVAFNEYCQRYEGLNLLIAGSGDVSDIKEGISGNPRIILLNRRIPITELVSLIEGCRFVVCPYTDATHSAVTVVSYAFGKAVMAHDVGGLREVIIPGKTGMLMENLEPETIINGIVKLKSLLETHNTKQKIEELTRSGILSWEKIAREYEKVYAITADNGGGFHAQ